MSKEQIQTKMDELGLKFETFFIPQSFSRNKHLLDEKPPKFNLNYTCTLIRGTKKYSFEYSMGVGCVEGYQFQFSRFPIMQHRIEHYLSEFGTYPDFTVIAGFSREEVEAVIKKPEGAPRSITPDPIDMLWSLVCDAQAGDGTFKDFCDIYGENDDSIKAKETFEACQKTRLNLLHLLGWLEFEVLEQLFHDY